MCSLVISLCSRYTFNGSILTGLTCSKVPGFWIVEHQLVSKAAFIIPIASASITSSHYSRSMTIKYETAQLCILKYYNFKTCIVQSPSAHTKISKDV